MSFLMFLYICIYISLSYCPVEGGWSEWGEWQLCSVTCGNGMKKRQRTCSEPIPQCDGSCRGAEEETAPCSTEIICPSKYSFLSFYLPKILKIKNLLSFDV